MATSVFGSQHEASTPLSNASHSFSPFVDTDSTRIPGQNHCESSLHPTEPWSTGQYTTSPHATETVTPTTELDLAQDLGAFTLLVYYHDTLNDTMRQTINSGATGHIHTPDLQHEYTSGAFLPEMDVQSFDLSQLNLQPDPWHGPEDEFVGNELSGRGGLEREDGKEDPTGHMSTSTLDNAGEEDNGHKWDLRPAPRLKDTTFHGAHIDQDDSGDYGDTPLNQRPVTTRVRKVAEHLDEYGEENQEAHQRPRAPLSWLKGRQEGFSLEVTLKLTSNRGRELLALGSLTGKDNWPDEEGWNYFDEDALEEEAAGLAPEANYLLRSQLAEKRRKAADNGAEGRLASPERRHHLHDLQQVNLTGHPEGRGCKACRKLEQACSMVEPNGTYPCEACIEDNCECEPLVVPRVKTACNTCRKNECSYLEGGDHSMPCFECHKSGFKCIAGPAIDLQRVRMTAEGKPAFTVRELEKRKRKAQKSKKRKAQVLDSGLDPHAIKLLQGFNEMKEPSSVGDFHTLNNHRTYDVGKIVEQSKRRPNMYVPQALQLMGIPEPKQRLYAPGKAPNSFGSYPKYFSGGRRRFRLPARIPSLLPSRRAPSPTAPMAQTFASQATLLTITTIETMFAHPIAFNAPTDEKRPCHFHTRSCMPIMGHGSTLARVYVWPSGGGYSEVKNGGGHTSNGCEPTRICYGCTSARISICLCTNHQMEAIPDQELSDSDVNSFLKKVLDANTEEEISAIHGKCCSLCPRAAGWTCAKTAPENEKEAGCGLRLCEVCKTILTAVFDRNLQQMLQAMEVADDFYPVGLRADARFFEADGLMMKQLLSSTA